MVDLMSCEWGCLYDLCLSDFPNFGFWVCRAAAIPRAKHGSYLQMKLVYNQLAPFFLFLMQWLDCSCTCILPRYLNFFHILVYKAGLSFLDLFNVE